MLAPLATVTFLVALWLVAKTALDLVADNGAKIAAAFNGRSMLARPAPSLRPISVRFTQQAASVRRPVHAQPEWRAAA